MGVSWVKTHYIRKNYYSLYEKYRGKSVVFLFKDFNDLKNLRITDENIIEPTIYSVQDGLYEKSLNDPYGNNWAYFPLENEYEELLHNYREKTKISSFDLTNRFEFNLEIYFENNIEIFPNSEIDEAIIERINEYINKKRKIMNEIQSHKQEQDQLREEAKELLKNIGKENGDLERKVDSFRKRLATFDIPDINNLILRNLLTKLCLRGSEKVLDYLKENPFSILQNLGNELSQYFDCRELISKEFMNYILYLYKDKNSLNLHTFIEKTVFYNQDRRKDIKNFLYTEDLNLLEIYYGCMFRAIDNDLPQSLKDKIPSALKTLEKIDYKKLRENELKRLTPFPIWIIEKYKQELKKIENDFLEKRPTKEEYREYLFSKNALDEKIKDISLRCTEEELLGPITVFLITVLSNNSLSYKEKDLVYNFLYLYDFKNFKELEPTLKEQLQVDINFNEQILRKIHFSKNELDKLSNHPSLLIRTFARGQFGTTGYDPEAYIIDTWPFRKITPIIMYKGVPQFLGYLLNDDRIIKKIEGLKEDRFETIDSNKRIIKITQEEMMELITRENEFYIKGYEELLKEKNKNLDFYLLLDNKKIETSTDYIKKRINEREQRMKSYWNKLKENNNGN